MVKVSSSLYQRAPLSQTPPKTFLHTSCASHEPKFQVGDNQHTTYKHV